MGPNGLYRVLNCVNACMHTFRDLVRSGTYLDLVNNVESIGVSIIRENNLHQGVCNAISAVGRPFKGVLEVGCGILNRSMATQNDKAGDTNALMIESEKVLCGTS